jgi:hypothetical protein
MTTFVSSQFMIEKFILSQSDYWLDVVRFINNPKTELLPQYDV